MTQDWQSSNELVSDVSQTFVPVTVSNVHLLRTYAIFRYSLQLFGVTQMPHNEPRYCSRSCLGNYSTSQVTPLAICGLTVLLSYHLDLSSEVRDLLGENARLAVKAGIEDLFIPIYHLVNLLNALLLSPITMLITRRNVAYTSNLRILHVLSCTVIL